MLEWLKEIREKREMTQDAVASGAGISRTYYTNIENGKRGDPLNVDVAKKIAVVLDFDWTRFYEKETIEK